MEQTLCEVQQLVLDFFYNISVNMFPTYNELGTFLFFSGLLNVEVTILLF